MFVLCSADWSHQKLFHLQQQDSRLVISQNQQHTAHRTTAIATIAPCSFSFRFFNILYVVYEILKRLTVENFDFRTWHELQLRQHFPCLERAKEAWLGWSMIAYNYMLCCRLCRSRRVISSSTDSCALLVNNARTVSQPPYIVFLTKSEILKMKIMAYETELRGAYFKQISKCMLKPD